MPGWRGSAAALGGRGRILAGERCSSTVPSRLPPRFAAPPRRETPSPKLIELLRSRLASGDSVSIRLFITFGNACGSPSKTCSPLSWWSVAIVLCCAGSDGPSACTLTDAAPRQQSHGMWPREDRKNDGRFQLLDETRVLTWIEGSNV